MKIPNDNKAAFLEKYVKEFKIFIDTCSLLEESADKFFQSIVPILERERKALVVPLTVYRELEKLAKSPAYYNEKYPNNSNLTAMATRACETLVRLQRARLVEIFADPDDGNFADNVFLYVFRKKCLQYNMLLITQDRGLASETLKIGKDNRAVKGIKKIFVFKLDENGCLQKIFNDKPKKIPHENSSEKIPPNERFAFSNKVVDIEGNLPVSHVPKEGDCLTAIRGDKTRQIRLREQVGSGGEGSVYNTDFDGFVAKIYKPEKITRLRHEKLKLMLSKDINCEGVCFPLALLHNQRNEFVGYLMKSASGHDLGKSVFMPMLLKKYFPKWSRIDTVQLCVTILKKIKYLHDRNVILGDINPYNILVVSPTEVYFVDTDSYQVEGFICPVGMPLFTPPELQKKKYTLRTLGNENFALATLLFMIMHPGKPPYAMRDGEGIVENIIKGEFSYPLGERKTGKVPQGPWRFCWSHLTYRIKEAFYETFWRDGIYRDEKKRPDSGFWLSLFEEYLRLLQNGTMVTQDEEALMIFPTRFKKDRNKNYAKCKLCGREFETERLVQGICRDCLRDGEKYQCARCGEEMIYTNRQRYIEKIERPKLCHKHFKKCKVCREEFDENQLTEGVCRNCLLDGQKYKCADCGREIIYTNRQRYVEKVPRPKLCKKCLNKKNRLWQQRKCVNCGKMFNITYGQKEFFEQKGLHLPTRCEDCRGKPNQNNNFVPKRTILKLMRNDFR